MAPVLGGATGRDTHPEASQQVPMWARGGLWGSRAQLEPQQVVPERLGARCGLQKQGLGAQA